MWGVKSKLCGEYCVTYSGIPVPITIHTSFEYCVRLVDLWMLLIIHRHHAALVTVLF